MAGNAGPTLQPEKQLKGLAKTTFSSAANPPYVPGLKRWQKFHIATYAVSILFLVPALFIFSTYKQLQVQRITMHKNLFASLIVNAALEITFKTVVVLDELDTSGNRRRIMEENWPGCRLLYTLAKYTDMCTSMWMFCEAFYIHKLIAASFVEQKSLFMFYFIGWIFPIFPVITVAILRWIFADERKVVRATLMLIPLFGLHCFLVMYKPKSGNCFLLEGYSFFRYALDGLQGFLISVIFCYLNRGKRPDQPFHPTLPSPILPRHPTHL